MQFDQFRGRDVAEALAQVKAAFGANALIGSTRVVTNGRGGALGHSFVEVTAAPGAEAPRKPSVRPRAPVARHGRRMSEAPKAAAPAPVPAADTSAVERALGEELRALRALVEEMAQARRPKDRAMTLLAAQGFDGSLAAELAAQCARAAREGTNALRRALRDRIAARVKILPSPIAQPGSRVVACVGAAGVGKTTTLAKLAARARLDLGRSVTLVTLDTFRVGAVEHSRRYAQLIGLNFEVAHDVKSFNQALTSTRDDLILVDTPSRASNEATALGRLVECLRSANNREVCVLLTVAASSRARDVDRIAADYSACGLSGVVVTKLDETDQVGGALTSALRDGSPLAYLCEGPRVPEDIQDASVDAVVDRAFPAGE
ncbi:MAG TPA: flagellar biosynthesis protein FlhF [Polyangiaceae bacterium]|nr:flagellar biosynthesis protein FlhF [Polyangiaceae bacterium]